MIDEADSTQLDFLDSRLLLQSWQLRKISFGTCKCTAFDEEVIEGARINMRHQDVILKSLYISEHKRSLRMRLGIVSKPLCGCTGVLT